MENMVALPTRNPSSFPIPVALNCSIEAAKGMANTVWMVHAVMQRELKYCTYICFMGMQKGN